MKICLEMGCRQAKLYWQILKFNTADTLTAMKLDMGPVGARSR